MFRVCCHRRLGLLVTLTLILLANAVGWMILDHRAQEPPPLRFAGLAYAGFRPGQNPFAGTTPSSAEIAEDLALLAPVTRHLRTYGALGSDPVLQAARVHGLRVTLGVWLDRDLTKNEAELAAGITAAHAYPDVVDALVVGNETLLRGDLTADQLLAYTRRAQTSVSVPVATAETWHTWTLQPELARTVDFLMVHILPYWEGVPREAAVPFLQERYEELRARYPGKRLVIGETGWPSAGEPFEGAVPGEEAQQRYLADFLRAAEQHGLAYFYLEAFDQPWKGNEGSVGPHWGVFTAARDLKPALLSLASMPSWLRAPWPLWAALTAGIEVLLVTTLARARHLRARARLALWVFSQAAMTAVVLLGLALVHPAVNLPARLGHVPIGLG
ncbi:MAG: glycoside hydrolase, partial [Actinomycetota bacterium]|nr:glycoside hydrolase [Actinomycetota bacterium]